MNWTQAIGHAISYIETHITEPITADAIAREVCLSPFYFQKGFRLLCGVTLAEYIRNRRLTLAGRELSTTEETILAVAIKYGYDSPDSFCKAFTRFHGITPSMARKNGAILQSFAPLKLSVSLKGGYSMDYKIVKKDTFSVVGVRRTFSYENATQEVPAFWRSHYASGNGAQIHGMFGINIDETMSGVSFEYLIADLYNPALAVPDGCIIKTIPAFTWAIFPCRGPMPQALQDVNHKIFSEWLPALGEYEFAAGYCIEWYDQPENYPLGTMDPSYYSEIWIPIAQR